MAQTEEDFNRILTLHNEIARALTSKNDLNYQFVSDATAEIKKRASRRATFACLRSVRLKKRSSKKNQRMSQSKIL